MSLPNPGMDAVPFTPLTAEFLDDMTENIEYLETKPVTNSMLSTTAGELGGAWKDWNPDLAGWSGAPTVLAAKYREIGKDVMLSIVTNPANISNATTKYFSLPVPPALWQDAVFAGWAMTGDTSNYAGAAVIRTSGSSIQVYRGQSGVGGNPFTPWSASGAAAFTLSVRYEAA